MLITILDVLLAVSLVAVVAILLTGVFGFAISEEFNRKYSNKLMRARVATQALAIVLLLLRIAAQGWAN
jgi:preprotein translocase subunit SecG